MMFKKLFLKFYFRGFGFKYYPLRFKKSFLVERVFPQKINNSNFKKGRKAYRVELASECPNLSLNNFWSKDNIFIQDRENYSLLHRWTWAIKLFSKNFFIKSDEIKFVEDSIYNWCLKNYKKKIDKKNILFEPYNISERISNYLILINLNIIKPDQFVLACLENQYIYLLENIEIYYKKKSNHALNNLRAIILFSSFVKNKKINNYALGFIISLLRKYIDKDGFFKFGSSNYQFIFTRWLADIIIFNNNINLKKIKIIKFFFNKARNATSYFYNKNLNLTSPNFGNISPDINNKWLQCFYFGSNKFFFKKYKKNFPFKIAQKRIISAEWFRLSNMNFTFYCRNPKYTGFDFNHSHNDFFHFVLYYKHFPLLVDLGRENYSKKNLEYFSSGNTHNSFLINNKPLFDDYLSHNFLTKIGLTNLKTLKYKVKQINNNKITMSFKSNNLHIFRTIIFKKKNNYNRRFHTISIFK